MKTHPQISIRIGMLMMKDQLDHLQLKIKMMNVLINQQKGRFRMRNRYKLSKTRFFKNGNSYNKNSNVYPDDDRPIKPSKNSY